MASAPDTRLAVQLRVQDLVPRAFAARVPEDLQRPEARWLHGPRLMFPHPTFADHWEVALAGEPFLYTAERAITGPVVGLRVEGRRGLARMAGLLDPARRMRLARFLDAAARLDDDATTSLAEVDPGNPGRAERPIVRRAIPANQMGAGVLRGLIETGLGLTPAHAPLDPSSPSRSRAPALLLAEVHVAPDQTVALRRGVARLVDMWRPVWGLPDPAPPGTKDELDRRLGAAYRRSLRMMTGRRPAAERAALRIEVRELARLYRESGRVRPRLLAVLVARLKLE